MDTAVPRRIAIVGAGPSGLFAAQALTTQSEVPVEVDLLDRLPTPYGLLRYGVAPDHTSIKSVANALAKTFDSPAVRFLGNVEMGRDVSREELLAAYDAVLYAAGASADVQLGVPGEDLDGSRSAREFVAWYSGHPDAPDQDLTGVRAAAVIGVGNVAVDVARILAKTAEALSVTDMPQPVLDALAVHHCDDIYVVARRGPQHAAFTTVELRELVHTPGVQVTVEPAGCLDGIPDDTLERRTRANLEILREAAATEVPDARRRLHFRFWHRPVALEESAERPGAVGVLVVEQTRLDEAGKVVGTGVQQRIPVQLVLRSIGYRSVPLPGVPFNERAAVVANVEGRVVDADGAVQPKEYVAGWLKRGPSGVIGTNKSCAAQTVRHLVADLMASDMPPTPAHAAGELDAVLTERGVRFTTLADWRAIDAAEIARGAERGRARTKIETWTDLLALC
ncbi:MAG TPA: FAD-dependent oxidoreductase [Dermatophilaceae bacterium]|nr:FAD-dependent oxidoreductase [Dermatophilaceae bacterium]